jgi:RNA polymerase sigma factor (sigma-70 family)
MRTKIKAVSSTKTSRKVGGIRKMIGRSKSREQAEHTLSTVRVTDFPCLARPNATLSLPEILTRYRESGDNMLAALLYRQFGHLVLGSAIRYLEDTELAKDTAMEIFLKVLGKLRTETPVHFPAWLYTVTKYHCLEILRRNVKMPKHEALEKVISLPDRSEDYLVQSEAQLLCAEKVRRALSGLPADQRDCVELFFMHELSYKEVAEETGHSLKAVKSHIQNGRRKLVLLLGPAMGYNRSQREAF